MYMPCCLATSVTTTTCSDSPKDQKTTSCSEMILVLRLRSRLFLFLMFLSIVNHYCKLSFALKINFLWLFGFQHQAHTRLWRLRVPISSRAQTSSRNMGWGVCELFQANLQVGQQYPSVKFIREENWVKCLFYLNFFYYLPLYTAYTAQLSMEVSLTRIFDSHRPYWNSYWNRSKFRNKTNQ